MFELYPDYLNPFGDDDNNDKGGTTGDESDASYDDSLNPFGGDEDAIEPQATDGTNSPKPPVAAPRRHAPSPSMQRSS